MAIEQTDPTDGPFLLPAEPPFGPSFFLSVLPDRVATACEAQPRQVPVVFVRLVDGTLLDLCHVPTLTPHYVVASVYRDVNTCDDMDLMFVPYQFIAWVKIALFDREKRALGFRLAPDAG